MAAKSRVGVCQPDKKGVKEGHTKSQRLILGAAVAFGTRGRKKEEPIK